jgi:hypothetical protein
MFLRTCCWCLVLLLVLLGLGLLVRWVGPTRILAQLNGPAQMAVYRCSQCQGLFVRSSYQAGLQRCPYCGGTVTRDGSGPLPQTAPVASCGEPWQNTFPGLHWLILGLLIFTLVGFSLLRGDGLSR